MPDVIETIAILAACDKHMNENSEQNVQTALLGMVSDILGKSPDHIMELIQDNKAAIDIIND